MGQKPYKGIGWFTRRVYGKENAATKSCSIWYSNYDSYIFFRLPQESGNKNGRRKRR